MGNDISGYTAQMGGLSADNYSIVLIPPLNKGTSEDCLFLDVVVPKTTYDRAKKIRKNNKKKGIPKDKGIPVLVWIYGGGYVFADKNYWGNPAGLLARSQEDGDEGIVFVTINYRLRLFVSTDTSRINENMLILPGVALRLRRIDA
jgi:carboxylesterase type B